MKFGLLTIALCFASSLTWAADDGFTSIYAKGDPLKQGWKMVGPGSVKEESEGVLVTEGGMGMLWYAKATQKNFTLRVEYKQSTPLDNSGIFVRFPNEPKSPWDAVNEGYEIQICDGADPVHRTGAVYSFKPADKAAPTKPVGEWNLYEITVKGQEYTIKLNGEVINTYKGSRGEKGYVGIQNHDDKSIVRFRNIQLKSFD